LESIAKTEVEQKLLTLCSEQLEPKGYRIVDLDCRVGGRSLLRIYIERLPVDGATSGVGLSDCVEVSRSLGEFLETFTDIPGTFDLEVSSPGIDRRLRLRSDFDAFQGQEVDLKLVEKIEGIGGRLKGKVLGTDTKEVRLEWSGKDVAVPWTKIKQANRIWKTE
jgi:ribosome maturation factor RimP